MIAPLADPPPGTTEVAGWVVADEQVDRWAGALRELLAAAAVARPLDPSLPAALAVQRLGLPDPALLGLVAASCGAVVDAATVSRPGTAPVLSAEQRRSLDEAVRTLTVDPFAGVEGLGADLLRAAARAGELVHVGRDVYLRPAAVDEAVRRLRDLPQPFGVGAARDVLGTTRRVAVPLLEHLDGHGRTRRVDPAGRRVVTG